MIIRKFLNSLWVYAPFILVFLLPDLVFAADSNNSALNFKPPPQDVSIIFLSNIFGVVGGVLHGTGSQIIGQMFNVFNTAVISLGGIIIVYTLLVSTMNTAHEGEMLGKKWSSVWVPIRAVFGVGMMLPKTTGYCMMQVLVMWVVVQGVGAADKVWDAALNYLQRGGVIIQPNVSPNAVKGAAQGAILKGAAGILAGQVCMEGLKELLDREQKKASDSKDKAGSICYQPTGDAKTFCENAPPNFINSVNLSTAPASTVSSGTSVYSVPMPNFDSSVKLYSNLNGICGTIQWNGLSSGQTSNLQAQGLTQGETDSAQKARSIAMQQMYDTLAPVAQAMVANDPTISGFVCGSTNDSDSCVNADRAKDAFGVPLTNAYGPCEANSNCTAWGVLNQGSTGTTLLSGTELQGAAADYVGIMLPTLRATSQSSPIGGDAGKKFIETARQAGWLMAGAYFFQLAALNTLTTGAVGDSSAESSGVTVDKEGGGGQFDAGDFVKKLSSNCPGSRSFFCSSLSSDWYYPMLNLMNGYGGASSLPNWNTLPDVTSSQSSIPHPNYSQNSNTVFSYLVNASTLQLPGQAGQNAPTFKMHFNFNPSTPVNQLPGASFSGGFMGIPGAVTTLIYNNVVRYVFNVMLQITMPIINQLFFILVSPPILLLSSVFASAIKIISDPTNNPIIALAQMGSAYINGVATMWVQMAGMAAGASVMGPAAIGLLMIVFPVILTWMAVMVGVGANCAYYVPFIPYLLFTFGVFAWMIGVIEAMCAAPIVALGVTHPEGHEAFGKGDQAIMLILNVFLRPAMMIFGYIFGIILSFVGTWLINAGFGIALGGIYNIGTASQGTETNVNSEIAQGALTAFGGPAGALLSNPGGWTLPGIKDGANKAYSQWTGLFMYFFSILIYTTIYVAVVQKSFTLIYMLPDKILRWLSGGQQESLGEGVAGALEKEAKAGAEKGEKAVGQNMDQLTQAKENFDKAKGKGDSGGGGGGMAGGSAASSSAAG